MDSFSIKDLAKIIERDSKDATYKFALLRATIEIIQEHDNYKSVNEEGVSFPMGLLILKWIEYYYPFLATIPLSLKNMVIPGNGLLHSGQNLRE